jgi:hypothetical protein
MNKKGIGLSFLMVSILAVALFFFTLFVLVSPEKLIGMGKGFINDSKTNAGVEDEFADFQIYDPFDNLGEEVETYIGSLNALVDSVNALTQGVSLRSDFGLLNQQEISALNEQFDKFHVGFSGRIELEEDGRVNRYRNWGFTTDFISLSDSFLKGKSFLACEEFDKTGKCIKEITDGDFKTKEGIKKNGYLFVPADYEYGNCPVGNGAFAGWSWCEGFDPGDKQCWTKDGEYGSWSNSWWQYSTGLCSDKDSEPCSTEDLCKYQGTQLYDAPLPIRDIKPLMNIRLTTYKDGPVVCDIGTNDFGPDDLEDFVDHEKYNDLKVWGCSALACKEKSNCAGLTCDRDGDGIRGSFDSGDVGEEFIPANFPEDWQRIDAEKERLYQKYKAQILASGEEQDLDDATARHYANLEINERLTFANLNGKVQKNSGEGCSDSPTFAQCPGIKAYYCGKWGFESGKAKEESWKKYYQFGNEEFSNLKSGEYHARAGAKFYYELDPEISTKASSFYSSGSKATFRDADGTTSDWTIGSAVSAFEKEVNIIGHAKYLGGLLAEGLSFGLIDTDLSTNDILELETHRAFCQKAIMQSPDGKTYGGAGVVCDGGLRTCAICNFNLPQDDVMLIKGTAEYEKNQQHIAGYGDPKFLIYFEYFPRGEEHAWIMDEKVASLWILAAENAAFNLGIPVGGAVIKGFTKLAKIGIKGSAILLGKTLKFIGKKGVDASFGVVSIATKSSKAALKSTTKVAFKETFEKTIGAALERTKSILKIKPADQVKLDKKVLKTLNKWETETLKKTGKTLDSQLDDAIEFASKKDKKLIEDAGKKLMKLTGKETVTEAYKAAMKKGVRNFYKESGELTPQAVALLKKNGISVTEGAGKVIQHQGGTVIDGVKKGGQFVSDADVAKILEPLGSGAFGFTTPAKQLAFAEKVQLTKAVGVGLTKTVAKAGTAYALAAAWALEDSMAQKYYSLGLSQLGFKTPYQDVLVSGNSMLGIHKMSDSVKPYQMLLIKDQFNNKLFGQNYDQESRQFYLASPCVADLAVSLEKVHCLNPLPQNEDGTKMTFDEAYTIQKIKVGSVEEDVVFLKNYFGADVWKKEKAMKFCAKGENVDCGGKCNHIRQKAITVMPNIDSSVIKQGYPNFCFSGATPVEDSMQIAILVRTLVFDLALEIPATILEGATSWTVAGPLLIHGVKGTLQTVNDVVGALQAQDSALKKKWPNHPSVADS